MASIIVQSRERSTNSGAASNAFVPLCNARFMRYSRHMRRMLLIAICGLGLLSCAGCARLRPPRGVSPRDITLLTTGYCRCGKCCGWKRTWLLKPVFSYGPLKGKRKQVGVTASGSKARVGTIAADTRQFPFGTIMYIEGYGYGRVEDRGGAVKGAHIDLFFRNHKQALEWGRRTKRVRVWLPK